MTEGNVFETEVARVPEFKTHSLENLGQVMKVSGRLEPDVFPYRVKVEKSSNFFRSVDEGVHLGKGVTVRGSSSGKRRLLPGRLLEYTAVLGINDVVNSP